MPCCVAQRKHLADLVVGLQHDAAALTDAVDADLPRGGFLDDRAHGLRALARGDFDAVCGAVGKPLRRCRQIVRVPHREVERLQDLSGGDHRW